MAAAAWLEPGRPSEDQWAAYSDKQSQAGGLQGQDLTPGVHLLTRPQLTNGLVAGHLAIRLDAMLQATGQVGRPGQQRAWGGAGSELRWQFSWLTSIAPSRRFRPAAGARGSEQGHR